ncbi:MAG: hypothetical protein EOO62_34080, partial [Hymenobacter sp.]
MSLLPNVFPASLDDLVFEGRNKAYGAYQLRQAYNGHVRKALSTIIGLCALLLLSGAAWQRLHPAMVATYKPSVPIAPITPPTYVTEPPKPIAPPAAPSRPHSAAAAAVPHTTGATLPTLVAKDELVVPKTPVTTEIVEVSPSLATTGPTTTNEAGGAGSPTGTGTAEAGSEGGTSTAPAVAGPYVVVE